MALPVLGLAACDRGPVFPMVPLATNATVATDGVEIVSDDGTIKLTKDTTFPIAARTGNTCRAAWTTDDWKQVNAHATEWGVLFYSVRVKVPQLPVPLYGRLVFCGIDPDAKGPASRGYRVVVPDDYVQATSDGRMSVVFEPYDAGASGSHTSWALWLSRAPVQ